MRAAFAFVFDSDRCTGCEACRVACGIENNEGRDTGWRTITTFNPSRHPALPTWHLSLACNHCDTTPCASGCPASAYARDAATGAVLLDPAKCIGCRYCSWLCPYDAPKFDADRGVMTKCTFCAPRLARGDQPACTAACPTGALSVGAREAGAREPSSTLTGGFGLGDRAADSSIARIVNGPRATGAAEAGLGPALRIAAPRREASPPALSIDALVLDAIVLDAIALDAIALDTIALDTPSQPLPPRKITLRAEWALLLFTIAMPALVAWLGGGLFYAARMPPLPIFAGIGALVLVTSTLHLGKPLRAWRAILNVRTSWLSREIVFTNLFLLFGAALLALPHADGAFLALPLVRRVAAVLALASGLGLAVSIDGVYRAIPRAVLRAGSRPIPSSTAPRLHSAEAVPTMALLFGIAAGMPLVAIAAATLKAGLFGWRWARGEAGTPPAFGAIRILVLIVACVPTLAWPLAFALAILGEIIDRGTFYRELEPTSPARRMA